MPAVKEVLWGTPPEAENPNRGRPSVYPQLLQSLAERPGEWGIVAIGKTDSVAAVKTAAKRVGVPAEVVSRRHENNGQRATWARVIPDTP